MKTFVTLILFAAAVAAVVPQRAAASVLYWFTAEGQTVGTTYNFGTVVPGDVGNATAHVSDGTDTIVGGPQNGQTSHNAQAYAIQIVNAPSPMSGRPGTKAVRFEVRSGDFKYVGHRSEFAVAPVPSGGVYWYSWSVYVPSGVDEPWDEILGQAHGADNVIGSPVLAINRMLFGNTMDWALGQVGGTPTAVEFTRFKFEPDVWVDWVIQVKWARDNTGFYNVWRNGVLVASDSGFPTDYTAASTWPYFKFGNYKWTWKTSTYTGSFPTRVQYYDEVKIGDASETYASMVPRSKVAPTDVTANGGNALVALNWTGSAPATSYNVKRATVSGGPYTTVGSPSATSFTDNTAVNNTLYYYVVTAVTGVGESANSVQVSATPYAAQVAAPTYSPAAGTYSSVQSVSLSSATSGATIRYSTDGSTPTITTGTVYSAPISIGTTTTLKSIAYKSGVSTSALTTGLYTRNSAVGTSTSAGAGWTNTAFVAPSNLFTATFSASTSAATTTAVWGLANGTVSGYSGVAAAISFGSDGKIAVRDAGAYKADAPYFYTAGTTFRFRMVVDITNHIYSVYVTGPGGPEVTLAKDYKFRTEQAGVTTLDSLAATVDATGAGTLTVGNFAVSSLTPPSGTLTDVDVGSPTLAGSASLSAGTWSVSGAGTDIWTTSDQFNYAYQSVSGDTTIIARITAQPNTNNYAKAGVMIRESNAANSKFVFMLMSPAYGIRMHYRSTTGGSAAEAGNAVGVVPYWFKLVRSGNTFTGSRSTDGVTWTTTGSTTVTMTSAVNVGLAVTSKAPATLNTSTFTNLSITTP